jgi:hypothetical protein
MTTRGADGYGSLNAGKTRIELIARILSAFGLTNETMEGKQGGRDERVDVTEIASVQRLLNE